MIPLIVVSSLLVIVGISLILCKYASHIPLVSERKNTHFAMQFIAGMSFTLPLINLFLTYFLCKFTLQFLSTLDLSINKRFQCKKVLHRRQLGNGTELTSLRAMSGNLITEFNPNYEFAGNPYNLKDLPRIARDCISLTRLVQVCMF